MTLVKQPALRQAHGQQLLHVTVVLNSVITVLILLSDGKWVMGYVMS